MVVISFGVKYIMDTPRILYGWKHNWATSDRVFMNQDFSSCQFRFSIFSGFTSCRWWCFWLNILSWVSVRRFCVVSLMYR